MLVIIRTLFIKALRVLKNKLINFVRKNAGNQTSHYFLGYFKEHLLPRFYCHLHFIILYLVLKRFKYSNRKLYFISIINYYLLIMN